MLSSTFFYVIKHESIAIEKNERNTQKKMPSTYIKQKATDVQPKKGKHALERAKGFMSAFIETYFWEISILVAMNIVIVSFASDGRWEQETQSKKTKKKKQIISNNFQTIQNELMLS